MRKAIRIALISTILFLIPSIASAQQYVKKGDTLGSIAKQNGMGLKDIISLNPQFENPNLIHIGDLVITRTNSKAHDIVAYAKSLQDVTAYSYGGQEPPLKTDCSGFVQYVYKKFGVNLPRTSREQAKVGAPIPFKKMEIADLMFFSTRADKVITHTGIFMGQNLWISNLNEKKDVEILSTWGAWTQKYFLWAQRVI